MSQELLTPLEEENCRKVKNLLLETPGLAIKNLREDLFLISEPETGVEFTVDVEGATLFLRAEVAEVDGDVDATLFKKLLEINGRTVHVAFALEKNTVVIRGNLEIENLDANELEASCKSLILTLFHSSDEIAGYIKD